MAAAELASPDQHNTDTNRPRLFHWNRRIEASQGFRKIIRVVVLLLC